MANKKTRALDRSEFELIIDTIKKGFNTNTGEKVRPNIRIATALTLQANIGLRIGDVIKMRLSDIVYESGRYHFNSFIEGKTKKQRTFTVPVEVYSYLQSYALEYGITTNGRLFNLTERAVQKHLQLVCNYLGLEDISTHSFRKFFANTIYIENDYDVELVRELLQHSSVAVTQHYLSVDRKQIERALQKHIYLPIQ